MKQTVKNHLDNLLETVSNMAEAGHNPQQSYARLAGAVDAFLIMDAITLDEAKQTLTRGDRAMKEG